MHFKTDRIDHCLWLLALALLAFLAVSQLSLAWVRSPSADDAMFLSVPKNWLNGYGWATSYSEKIPFNPDFTGPTSLLWLCTPLIALFGPQLWIAGITGAVTNLLLLGLCLQQLRQYWPQAGLCALALVSGCLASQAEDFASLIGYYTGSLLFLLACCVAFNPALAACRRATLIGLLMALALLTKMLLLPAFLLLGLAFFRQQRRQWPALLLRCAAPLLLLAGGWQCYRHAVLQAYSDEFLAVHADYGRQFFLYHGSGIGQWLDAAAPWQYVWRNIDRNLYFVEESLSLHGLRYPWLGDEPADIHHRVGLLFLGLLLAFTVRWARRLRAPAQPVLCVQLVLLLTVVTYLAWFLFLAMAMSPGHLFFPMQWVLWLALLSVAQAVRHWAAIGRLSTALGMLLVSLGWLMPAEGRQTVLLFGRDTVPRTQYLAATAQHLQDTRWPAPLAGCGYSGYPRHLEFLLLGSQNFADCLDTIEDHVEQDTDGRFHWRSVPELVVVMSRQSIGFNSATSPVLAACIRRVLYRHEDTIAVYCDREAMQSLDLDTLMPAIRSHQGWYRTRLMPYDGRHFAVLRRQ